MNEYFQQLKCKKEGLCVYAVLRANLFIASLTKITDRALGASGRNEAR